MASNHNIALMNKTALAANADGDTKSVNPSYTKFIGVLVVANKHADTTVTAKIQHSHDGVVWTSICDFTAVGATLHEHKQITANVLPYVRGIVTLAGATKLADVKIDLYFDK